MVLGYFKKYLLLCKKINLF